MGKRSSLYAHNELVNLTSVNTPRNMLLFAQGLCSYRSFICGALLSVSLCYSRHDWIQPVLQGHVSGGSQLEAPSSRHVLTFRIIHVRQKTGCVSDFKQLPPASTPCIVSLVDVEMHVQISLKAHQWVIIIINKQSILASSSLIRSCTRFCWNSFSLIQCCPSGPC